MITNPYITPTWPTPWSPPVPWVDVRRLGAGLRQDMQGNYHRNDGLIEALVRDGGRTVRPLSLLLQNSMDRAQIIEALYLAQRLAEEKAPNVRLLYAAAARFNISTDPDIQSYLAGFYRKLNVPESFGPMLEMLIRQSQTPQNPWAPAPRNNPLEEVGGTILQQLSENTADVMMARLKPQLAALTPQPVAQKTLSVR